MREFVFVAVVSAGCGRIAFDPREDGATGGDSAFDAAGECLDPNILGCWNFDGDTLDGTPSHNDATSTGATYVAGHRGMAILTGASVAHVIPPTTSLEVTALMTVEAWIRIDAYPSSFAFVFDNDNEYALSVDSGGHVAGTFVATGGLILTVATTPIPLGEWHHIAMRYDINTNFELVLDGVLDGTSVPMGPSTHAGTVGSRIGGDAGQQQFPAFVGAIDDLRVWRVERALSDLLDPARRAPDVTGTDVIDAVVTLAGPLVRIAR